MSMISAQADKLRERAKVLRQGRWSDGEEDARLMEYAADLILELRDDLQRSDEAVRYAEHDESMAWYRVRKAEAESAKLRELAKKMLKSIKAMDMDWCSLSDFETVNDAAHVYDFDVKVAPEYEEELRELGVEVDA